MPNSQKPSIIGGFDYNRAFGFTRIFRSFKIATQPGKLAVALFMIVLMFVVGWVLDGVFGGGQVYNGEFQAFMRSDTTDDFRGWLGMEKDRQASRLNYFLDRRLQLNSARIQEITESSNPWSAARSEVKKYARAQPTEGIGMMRDLDLIAPQGVFDAIVQIKINTFSSLVDSAFRVLADGLTSKAMGWDQLNPSVQARPDSVIGAARTVMYEMPRWLWAAHPVFLVFWGVLFVGCWSLLGGAISRMCVVENATGERIGPAQAVGFAYRRWLAYALAPLIPLIFVGVFMLVLAVVGLLFHVPVLNIIGALAMIAAVPVGFLMAFFLIGWVGAVHLVYPAVSAEGTDAFDALSRGYSYVLTRPWRFITYSIIALAYGIITYLFVGLFIFLALYLVQSALATWTSSVAQVFPKPVLGHLRYEWTGEGLGWSAKIAAALIRVIVMLAVGLVAAYAISFYMAACSAIYLLLRGRADGTDESEIFQEPATPPAGGSSPAPQAPAAATPAAESAAPAEAPEKAPDTIEAD